MSLVAPHIEYQNHGGAAAAFLRDNLQALARDSHAAPGLVMITVPAPVAPLETLACTDEHAVLWDPPSGPRFAGVGHALSIAVSGPDRIARLKAAAEPVWPRLRCIEFPNIAPVQPRLFGGFAFAAGSADAAQWRGFGDARFVLPTWLYACDKDSASLSLTVNTAELDGADRSIAGYMAGFERVYGALDQAARKTETSHEQAGEAAEVLATSEMDPAAWRQLIENIHTAMEARRCDKIVAARCTTVALSRPPDPATVLAMLGRGYQDCYRFAYGFGTGAMFVGAPPERLIARTGHQVFTQALAGSIAADPDTAQAAAQTLLQSNKDRSEQDFVVQTIQSVLGPLCSEIEVPAEPAIRALPHVLHLETRIVGWLARPAHVLDLVAALHPTPAVGGVPTDAAMAWIAEHEPVPRGWYAAPVGWFDSHGQGEFAVAIRSGLLAGNQAHIYAGAGIVRDSDPDAEFAETRLKQRAVLDALGVKQ